MASPIARGLRYLAVLMSILTLAVVATVGWFQVAANWRETLPPGHIGHPGAYASVAGIDIHYQTWGPAGGPPILLIHGTMAWSGTWFDIGERLAACGFRVIAPDMPPFGYSTRPANGDYSRQAQARLITGFADTIGLEKIVLVGHSFACGATIEAAFSNPDRIQGLVMLDAALSLDNPSGNTWMSRLFAAPVLGEALTASTFTNPILIPRGLRDFMADDRQVTDARAALYQKPLAVTGTSAAVADWLSTALLADERASRAANLDNYRTFHQPVVLIWGRQDTVTPLAQGEHLRALLPRSSLLVLDGVNHIPQVEDPDATAAAIAEFASALKAEATLLPETLMRRQIMPRT